jgi:nucleotide-binding universal stress UspA family protein
MSMSGKNKQEMNILLATDGSRYSEWSAGFLARLKFSSSDRITIFHAIDWIPFQYDEDFYFGTLKELKNRIAPDVLNPALEILSPTQAIKSVALDDGPPEQCILDAADNLDADLVVIGAKGAESFIFGNVMKSIMTDSTKPVLVVKAPYLKPGAMKILFATDGSEHSLVTGELLLLIPFADDTEVTVLNVTGTNESVTESERIVKEAANRLGNRFKNIHVRMDSGSPSSEILKAAVETETDLIAVGCRGLRGIKKMFGSVSSYVLKNSISSVLIGKTCG